MEGVTPFLIKRRVAKEPLLYKTSTFRLKSWRGNGSNIILLLFSMVYTGRKRVIECSVMMEIMGANNWIEKAINRILFLSVCIMH